MPPDATERGLAKFGPEKELKAESSKLTAPSPLRILEAQLGRARMRVDRPRCARD